MSVIFPLVSVLDFELMESTLVTVINVTLPPPDESAAYVHRIGRVGRADRMGLAISFVSTAPEKVWYHQCRQKSCNDARRCAIWYDEIGVCFRAFTSIY